MSIALSEDHQTLGATAADLLAARNATGANRALLKSDAETLPEFWSEIAQLGWLGLHLPESVGGSGFGLEELVVVVEELGGAVAPGPFLPTAVVSAAIHAAADAAVSADLLPALADGSRPAAFALEAEVEVSGGAASGQVAAAMGGALADLFAFPVGDDLVLVSAGDGVSVEVPANLDPSRRSARIQLDGALATVIAGGAAHLVNLSRLLVSAEAVGLATRCTALAADYAREREQFGRPIAMFQAVKHHCANMAVAAELATSAVWDAARAVGTEGDEFALTTAIAATLASPAADICANLNTQVQGGIAITWEADAHLYMRRAASLTHFLDAAAAASDVTNFSRQGVVRSRAVELPPEAEPMRDEVRSFLDRAKDLPADELKNALVDDRYLLAHWPEPYGRAAGAVEQLVIEEEFKKAGVRRPSLGITSWNVLTIIQYGTDDQKERWVLPAMRQDTIWCQLFSEPDAGSDAAGVKSKATRVEGGWIVSGQKVWTSDAHNAAWGLATIRTNPDVPKHDGITMMAIDMHADEVDVRPLTMTSGHAGFNEVFLNDVFVADDDVVGPVDGGWTVARATLGFESVSIGGDRSALAVDTKDLVTQFDANPERLPGGADRLGRHIATDQAIQLLNLRATHRAVAGGEPGPEGSMTKLDNSEIGQEATEITRELAGADALYLDGAGAMSGMLTLMHRGMSIAGGTSEIKRNQIGERILGLPRDPLIK